MSVLAAVRSHQVRYALYLGYIALVIGAIGTAVALLGLVGASPSSGVHGSASPASASAAGSGPSNQPKSSAAPLNPSSKNTPTTFPKAPPSTAARNLVGQSTPTTSKSDAPPIGTTYLPVAPGSGAGCTAGITEGNQWIKYTVRKGDNLSKIAQCFDLNGYEAIYHDNVDVIGDNPNLIYPGQVITIVNGIMTLASSSSK